jgi:hypothetical protein
LRGRLNFLPAAEYYWHCGRIECMVLSTAAVSCGSQSVLSTMGQEAEKNIEQTENLPTPPSKIKWSVPNPIVYDFIDVKQ